MRRPGRWPNNFPITWVKSSGHFGLSTKGHRAMRSMRALSTTIRCCTFGQAMGIQALEPRGFRSGPFVDDDPKCVLWQACERARPMSQKPPDQRGACLAVLFSTPLRLARFLLRQGCFCPADRLLNLLARVEAYAHARMRKKHLRELLLICGISWVAPSRTPAAPERTWFRKWAT